MRKSLVDSTVKRKPHNPKKEKTKTITFRFNQPEGPIECNPRVYKYVVSGELILFK